MIFVLLLFKIWETSDPSLYRIQTTQLISRAVVDVLISVRACVGGLIMHSVSVACCLSFTNSCNQLSVNNNFQCSCFRFTFCKQFVLFTFNLNKRVRVYGSTCEKFSNVVVQNVGLAAYLLSVIRTSHWFPCVYEF